MPAEQPLLDLWPGRCQYGRGNAEGSPYGPQCPEQATHRAWWREGGTERATRECCRHHADYYASAWVPFDLKMRTDLLAVQFGNGPVAVDEAAGIDYLAPPWA